MLRRGTGGGAGPRLDRGALHRGRRGKPPSARGRGAPRCAAGRSSVARSSRLGHRFVSEVRDRAGAGRTCMELPVAGRRRDAPPCDADADRARPHRDVREALRHRVRGARSEAASGRQAAHGGRRGAREAGYGAPGREANGRQPPTGPGWRAAHAAAEQPARGQQPRWVVGRDEGGLGRRGGPRRGGGRGRGGHPKREGRPAAAGRPGRERHEPHGPAGNAEDPPQDEPQRRRRQRQWRRKHSPPEG